MRVTCNWLRHPSSTLFILGLLLLALPLLSRYALGWSHAYGYLSDLAIGSLLLITLHQRTWLLSVPLLVAWCIFTLGNAELVSAVGRMPGPADLHYLADPQFVSHSTQGAGLSQPL
ncbi:MAG: LTA synthase family protein, partial [Gammaproteobacteria bacterium]|nr:LTA synthase family protein [Gammaproteobacteria bacterium]